jgi:hypothetical protein
MTNSVLFWFYFGFRYFVVLITKPSQLSLYCIMVTIKFLLVFKYYPRLQLKFSNVFCLLYISGLIGMRVVGGRGGEGGVLQTSFRRVRGGIRTQARPSALPEKTNGAESLIE